MQGVQVWSLVGELRSHMPRGQKTKTLNRSNIVTNSIKTLKMVPTSKKKKNLKRKLAVLFHLGNFSLPRKAVKVKLQITWLKNYPHARYLPRVRFLVTGLWWRKIQLLPWNTQNGTHFEGMSHSFSIFTDSIQSKIGIIRLTPFKEWMQIYKVFLIFKLTCILYSSPNTSHLFYHCAIGLFFPP